MTEPIAVDVPAKPSFSRTGPGLPPVPGTMPLPASTPAPKVESASKPSSAPPTIAVGATVAAAAIGVPPVALAPAATGFLARFTKRRFTIGASAVFSLFAGIGAVRMMFPAKDDANPTVPVATVVDDRVKLNPTAPTPTKAPKTQDEQPSFVPVSALPPLPSAPTGGPPPTLRPTGIGPIPAPAPLAPPTVSADTRPSALPPLPDFNPPSPGVVPIAFPTIPPTPAGGIPPTPAPGVTPLPSAPTPPTGGLPPLPGLSGVVPPPALPLPSSDFVPKPPAPVALPDPTPKLPPLPDVKPPAAFDPKLPVGVGPPNVFPVDVNPKPEVKFPPPPAFDPPAIGTPTGFTKPAGASDAKPIVPEFAPKTTFDVDVHDPKANDTYETISLEFYNDRRFAAALRAFNQNAALQGGRYINVPPIHVLKRQFPAQTGGNVVPVGGSGTVPPVASATPDWTAPKPTMRNTFTVPQGGLTLPQVAKQALGNEQRWREIYDLNPWVTKPSEPLPAGTELKLP